MRVTVYGITTCSTVQKALRWLEEQGVTYSFHDFKTEGASGTLLKQWCKVRGWEKVMNRASLTYRNLTVAEKEGLDEARAIALMMQKPTLIRRPVVVADNILLQGFTEKNFREAFAGK